MNYRNRRGELCDPEKGKDMKKYSEMTKEELLKIKEELEKKVLEFKAMNLNLDMSRGKPCKEQLDLSMDLLSVLDRDSNLICEDGTDCRNYGGLTGIKEARELLATFMENKVENIIIYGNSSLNVMYTMLMQAYIFGVMGEKPWKDQGKIKFLCPVPGYDRHFAICEEFGIEMINIPMSETGPDMNMIEDLVAKDESIKGIWCVPKYTNPDGYVYSDDTVKRFARLKPKAKDFRIFWDNAYTVHYLYEDKSKHDHIIEILTECEKVGNPDIVYKFASTSKICFPGSGLAVLATSDNNIKDVMKHLKFQTIGYDKVNQLRHVHYFKNLQGIKDHMKKQANVIRPKFELVLSTFEKEFADVDMIRWTKPRGGYFVSFYGMNGTAKDIVAKCKEIGVKLTDAGSSYPYHKDPDDSNIRIAPTYPSLKDLETALTVFTNVARLITIEKLLK